MPRRAKWKHNENQINSTNFSAFFQIPSVFFPSMKYQFSFCISPNWIDDCVLVLRCFVNSLVFASNILLTNMNLLSCEMFMFRLSGAQVGWRWMAALIPFNTQLMFGLSLFSLQRRFFAEFHSSPLNLLFWDPLLFILSRTISRTFWLPTQLLSWCFSLELSAQFHRAARCLNSSFD